MRISSSLRFAAIVCLAVLGLAATEHRGVVTFGGLPLPGASVTALQGEKKVAAVTDAQGVYSFADLADGVWSLQVEMLCFTPLKREIAVAPNSPPAEWDMKLLPFDQIKAAAPPPAPPPPPSAVPAAAAASQAAPAASAAKASGKGKAKTAAAANSQSGYQRADVNASAGAPAPAAESDSGAAAGMASDGGMGATESAVVNGSTSNGIETRAFGNGRRGVGSMFNGNVMLVESNSALNARNYSLTGQNSVEPAYNNATFGGNLGGPLWIPHLLRRNGQFYIGYMGTRNRTANTKTTLLPTSLERSGDFSQSLSPLGQPVSIFDPNGGAPLPGNLVPAARIAPQAISLLKYYPQPNFLANSRYNFQIPLVSRSGADSVNARVNRTIDPKDFMSSSFSYSNQRGSNPNMWGFLDSNSGSGLYANASWRRTIEKTVYGMFSYNYSRQAQRNAPYFANRENVSGEVGITGNDQTPGDWGPPSLSFGNGIAGLSDGTLSLTRNQTHAVTSSITWIRRPHNMSFGGDLRRMQFNALSQQNPRGAISFNGTATQQLSGGIPVPGSGTDFADFLLGVPDGASISYGNADKYFRQGSYDLYADDDFRAASTLTVHGGVRWEYNSPVTEKYGRLVNLDVAPGFASAVPVVATAPTGPLTGMGYPDSLVRPDKHAVQPRVAIAWHPFLASSMLIRAGYSLSFDTSVYYPTIVNSMAQQSPLSKSLRIVNSPGNPLTLANPFVSPPGAVTNTFAIDPNFHIGYVQNWQASVQHDIPGSMVMTATYTGTKGTRAVQQFLPNSYPAGGVDPCPTCQSGYTYMTSNGNSTRESGMLQLRRRFHNGFLASAQYTYSKSIDDASLGGRGQGSGLVALNWRNLAGERGLSPFDQRHLLSAQLQYSTGVGVRGGGLLTGWRGRIVKGWTASTNITAGSGLPETPLFNQNVPGTGMMVVRPLYTGANVYDAPAGLFLNSAAYSAPLAGTWGNAGRNSIVGPNQFSMNASMQRSFEKKLDLTVSSTNALNHVAYTSWNTNTSSTQFGLASSTSAMRKLTVTLRWRF